MVENYVKEQKDVFSLRKTNNSTQFSSVRLLMVAKHKFLNVFTLFKLYYRLVIIGMCFLVCAAIFSS